jgi:NAD(P)-dependent dehydrogenase (short-subunit alcohol dehydrogenase family)
MKLDLSGKRALVTGSTLGIGRAIAESLLSEGAEVIINSRNADRVNTAVQELKSKGAVAGVVADLSSSEGANTLINKISNIDILVNNGLVCLN